MTCRLTGRIQTWTLAAALTLGCSVMTFAADEAAGTPAEAEAPAQVDLATQHAAKVNAAILAARRLEREGLWRQAAAKYSEVLQLMPGNDAASRGYQQAMAMLDDRDSLHSTKSSGVGSVQQRYQEQRSRAIIEFDDGVTTAKQLLAQEHFTAADRAILTAQIKLRQRKQWLSQAEMTDMNKQAESLISLIGESRVNARLLADQAAKEEVQASRTAQASKQETEKAKIINGNLRRVRQLQAELKYREALQVIDEILFIDPQNPAALALRDVIRTTEIYRKYAAYEAERAFGEAELSLDQRRLQQVPVRNLSGHGDRSISGVMTWPEDWPQLSHRRGTDGGYMMPPADRAVFRKLQGIKLPFTFPPTTTFESALNVIQEAMDGLKIYTDWRSLELDGIDQDTELELELNEQPLDVVLSRLLDQVGDDGNHPMWDVQDGMLVVSTKAALQRRVIPVVYDIRDLVMPIPDFN
ncbi:MAG: hypothetical protein HOL13_00100, partial [Phycisphaerae bacterium]|nr:hypothetical protein [Phycisphaerae bacterium]